MTVEFTTKAILSTNHSGHTGCDLTELKPFWVEDFAKRFHPLNVQISRYIPKRLAVVINFVLSVI